MPKGTHFANFEPQCASANNRKFLPVWTPVSLLTGERVSKLDRLSSVEPPFFHSLAAFGGERVEEWTGGGVSACFNSQNLGSCQTSWHGAKAPWNEFECNRKGEKYAVCDVHRAISERFESEV